MTETPDEMRQRAAQLLARAQILRSKAAADERKQRSRRLNIYGAALESAWSKMAPADAAAGRERLAQHITRPHDRAFLGLPPLAAPETDQDAEA